MSDEQLPPTHQPWGSRPPEPPPGDDPSSYPPPPNPYPQPGSFDQYAGPTPYAQAPNPYGTQPYQPAYGGGGLPEHPSATTALVLALVSLIGLLLCGGLTLPLAPFAWGIAGRALKEIDAQPGRYSGREKASAARIMGIIGTVLLVLGLLLAVGLVVLLVATVHSHTGTPVPTPESTAFRNS